MYHHVCCKNSKPNSSKSFSLDFRFRWYLDSKPYQMLLICQQTHLELFPLSNNSFIPFVIDKRWLMQEFPDLKPNWLVEIRWFVLFNLYSQSKSGIIRVFFYYSKRFQNRPVCSGDTWKSLNVLDILV